MVKKWTILAILFLLLLSACAKEYKIKETEHIPSGKTEENCVYKSKEFANGSLLYNGEKLYMILKTDVDKGDMYKINSDTPFGNDTSRLSADSMQMMAKAGEKLLEEVYPTTLNSYNNTIYCCAQMGENICIVSIDESGEVSIIKQLHSPAYFMCMQGENVIYAVGGEGTVYSVKENGEQTPILDRKDMRITNIITNERRVYVTLSDESGGKLVCLESGQEKYEINMDKLSENSLFFADEKLWYVNANKALIRTDVNFSEYEKILDVSQMKKIYVNENGIFAVFEKRVDVYTLEGKKVLSVDGSDIVEKDIQINGGKIIYSQPIPNIDSCFASEDFLLVHYVSEFRSGHEGMVKIYEY